MPILLKNIIQNPITQSDSPAITDEKNTLSGEFSAILYQLFSGGKTSNNDIAKYLYDSSKSKTPEVPLESNKIGRKYILGKSAEKAITVDSVKSVEKFSALQSIVKALEKKVDEILEFLESDTTTKTLLQRVKSGKSDLIIPLVFDSDFGGKDKKPQLKQQNYLVISFTNPAKDKSSDVDTKPDISLLSDRKTVSYLIDPVTAKQNRKTQETQSNSGLRFALAEQQNSNIPLFLIPVTGTNGDVPVVISVHRVENKNYSLSGITKRESVEQLKWKNIYSRDTSTEIPVSAKNSGESVQPRDSGENPVTRDMVRHLHRKPGKINNESADNFVRSRSKQNNRVKYPAPEKPIVTEDFGLKKNTISRELTQQVQPLCIRGDIWSTWSGELSGKLGKNLTTKMDFIPLNGRSKFIIQETSKNTLTGSHASPAFSGNSVGMEPVLSRNNPRVKMGDYVVINITGEQLGDSAINTMKSRLSGLLQKMNGTILIKEISLTQTLRQHQSTDGKSPGKMNGLQAPATGVTETTEILRNSVFDFPKPGDVSTEKSVNRYQKFPEPMGNTEYSEMQTGIKRKQSTTNAEYFEVRTTQGKINEKNSVNPLKYTNTCSKKLRPLDISATPRNIFEGDLHNTQETLQGEIDKKYSEKTNKKPSQYSTVQKPDSLSGKPFMLDQIDEFTVNNVQGAENSTNVNNVFDLRLGMSGNQSMNQIIGGTNQADNRVSVIQQVIDKLQSITQQVKANLVAQNAQNINARISLKPAHLGTVLLSLRFQENRLHGTIITSTHEAKQSIERQMPAIREAVQLQNISLQDIKIEVRTNINHEQRQSFADQFTREHSGSEHQHQTPYRQSESVSFSTAAEEITSTMPTGRVQVASNQIEYYA